MTTLSRIRVGWSGSAVTGPGVSTFYTAGPAPAFQAALRTFFLSQVGTCASPMSWTVQISGETIDDNTGEVNGVWTGGTGGAINATGSGSFARGVGMRVVWDTAGVTNGRHVRGSTFFVPIPASLFDSDGSLVPATVTSMLTAANALWTAADVDMQILTRLTPDHSGTSHEVTGVQVPDKVTWLKSRRT